MTQEQITEGNKLIAEFMRNEKVNPNASDDVYYFYYKYHKSWDWLMPVVEKIENLGCIIEIWLSLGKGCRIVKGSFKSPVITVAYTEPNSTIKSVYTAVVEFIKWYNEQMLQF